MAGMSNAWRAGIALAAVAIAVAAGLFFLLRGDGSEPVAETTTAGTTTAGTTTEETTPEETTTEDETTTEEEPAAAEFQVDVPAAGPQRVERLRVSQGETVALTVTLGWHDDVQVGGYGLVLHTGPGLPPALFEFEATTAGRFVIGTALAGVKIAELRVRP